MSSVSVVIPLYNKAPHISRAINSVLAQASPPEEIIVIDDGSTDGGGDIVKAYQDPRIRYIRQENQGVSAARNKGIAVAQGGVIAFLDADDAWKPEFLETILELRKLYPQAGAYATVYTIISPDGSTFQRKINPLEQGIEFELIDNIFKEEFSKQQCSSAIAIPKKVFEEVGGFPGGETHAEDIDTWIRIGIKFPIARSNRELAIYHQDAVNRVFQVKRISHEPALCRTARRLLQEGKVPGDLIEDFKEFVYRWQYYFVRRLIRSNQKSLARKLIAETKGTTIYNKQGKFHYILSYLPAKSVNYVLSSLKYINKIIRIKIT
jgi:glycosyltransferase involved in cell wall biosynthesis